VPSIWQYSQSVCIETSPVTVQSRLESELKGTGYRMSTFEVGHRQPGSLPSDASYNQYLLRRRWPLNPHISPNSTPLCLLIRYPYQSWYSGNIPSTPCKNIQNWSTLTHMDSWLHTSWLKFIQLILIFCSLFLVNTRQTYPKFYSETTQNSKRHIQTTPPLRFCSNQIQSCKLNRII